MRFFVGRPALLRQPFERALGSSLRSCGAGVAARGALGEDVDRRVEPDGDRAVIEQLARSRVDIGAAAGRDDPDMALDQPRHQPPLAIAEIAFAKALENLGRAEPVASSIAESLSTKASPSRRASRRPTVDFPTPICPTSTTGRSRCLVKSVTLRGYTAASPLGKSAATMPKRSSCCPDHRLVLLIGGLYLPFDAAQERPTHTIEVQCRAGGNAH